MSYEVIHENKMRNKREHDKLFTLGIVFAVIFHAVLIFFGPSYVLEKHKDRVIKVLETEDVPEIKIQVVTPPSIAAPAMPVPTDDTEVPLDQTIEDTEFNPYAPPPPPPPQTTDLSDAPTFIAYEDPPEVLKRVQPDYPELAQEAGLEGRVILNVFVDVDGKVKNAVVMKGIPGTGLDEAAIAAVKKWEYSPALQRGKPVGVWVSQIINFKLEQ